ncbi:MAG: DUF4175 domain-containing protein [Lentisphaerae bacterium]|nr:DUF4175 domain-containing protein [Lentisphaerota bacterium]
MRRRLKHLPRPVTRTLLGFYRRKRLYELMRSLIVPLLCYATLALIATHLDRFLFLDARSRLWISALTHGLSLLAGGVALTLFARRRAPVSRLAYELERMLPPTTAERLVTLNDVLAREPAGRAAGGPVHGALVEQLTDETVALCRRTPHAGRLARDRRLRRQTRALGLLAAAWMALLALPGYRFPLMLRRLTFPGRNLPKPSFMRLTVTPEAPVIGRGGEVVLQAQVEGEIPRLLRAPLRWLGADAGRSLLATAPGSVARLPVGDGARPMSRVQRRLFVASLGDLQESFSYVVRCGDAQTGIRFVRVVAQPRATDVAVEVDPPAYTGLKTARFEDLRDPIPAFAGSRVRLRFAADQSPLQAARLVAPQDNSTLAELKADPQTGAYLHEFEMRDTVEMEIVLINELGFRNVDRVRLSFALREDQPPDVRLEYPAGTIAAVQGELVPMHMVISDDLGLLEAGIRFQVNPEQSREAQGGEIPLPLEEGPLTQTLSAMFDLERAGVIPGDEVVLWVRARDTGRSDERSSSVRIRVTAFAGNENERRRLAALRLVGQALAAAEPGAGKNAPLAFNADAYQTVTVAAAARNLVLDSRPAPESLRDFLEREHHFTDDAAATAEVRMLRGVVAVLLGPPAEAGADGGDARKAALRRIADETLPALLRERMARDLVRRALALRDETLAMSGGAEAREPRTRAAFERRVDLLLEELDKTGADMAGLARMSPLIDMTALQEFTRQISRAGRDLKHNDRDRQSAAGQSLGAQIEGWVGLLLPALPEWQAERRAARAALRAEFDRLREPIDAAARSAPARLSAEAALWLAADARLVERSPFAGLGERLASLSPGAAAAANAGAESAMAREAEVLARAAVDSAFADWMAAAHARPVELRLANLLKAMDLAGSDDARAAAAEGVRALDIHDGSAPDQPPAPPPESSGLFAALPALTEAATAAPEPYDKALLSLAARTSALLAGLSQPDGAAQAEAMRRVASALSGLEAGLARWEADALRLSYRMHLDLAYGDPRREQTALLAAALPATREVLDRYRSFVPPLIGRLRDRLQRSPGAETLAAVTLEMEDLVRSVNAMSAGLTRAAKQLRREMPVGEPAAAVREMRAYYVAARKLAEADDPAAVAAAFFAEQPSAAAIVLEQRMRTLEEMRSRIREAGEALRAGTAADKAFLEAIARAAQLADECRQRLERFRALDADGAAGAIAADVLKRAKALAQPDRGAGPDTLSRDKLAADELQRQAEQLENRVRELFAANAPASPAGWWGGPAGVWDGDARRDAEHARGRVLAQYANARRQAALGFDAVLARGGKSAAPPDAALAGALFAWRTLHSSLGGGTVVRRMERAADVPHDELVRWLMRELDETRKALHRADGGPRIYRDPTSRWVDSAAGYLRSGN